MKSILLSLFVLIGATAPAAAQGSGTCSSVVGEFELPLGSSLCPFSNPELLPGELWAVFIGAQLPVGIDVGSINGYCWYVAPPFWMSTGALGPLAEDQVQMCFPVPNNPALAGLRFSGQMARLYSWGGLAVGGNLEFPIVAG